MEIFSQKACILPKIVFFEYIDIDLEERKIERHFKLFERERERKVLKILSASRNASATILTERERERSRIKSRDVNKLKNQKYLFTK